MNVPTFNEIWDRILSKKIIQKHKQYGKSLEEPVMIFNHYSVFPQDLIDVRVDDKLSRIRGLEDDDPKYWSEIEEIIAYLMWKLYLREEENRNIDYRNKQIARKMDFLVDDMEEDERADNRRHEGDKEQSPFDIRTLCDSHLPTLGLRRLPNGERRRLREEDFQ